MTFSEKRRKSTRSQRIPTREREQRIDRKQVSASEILGTRTVRNIAGAPKEGFVGSRGSVYVSPFQSLFQIQIGSALEISLTHRMAYQIDPNMKKYTSEEADELLNQIKDVPPLIIIRRLRFLWRRGFGMLFEYDSDHNRAWYLLGLAYEKIGKRPEAATCFLNAFFSYPKDMEALIAYTNTQDDLEKQVEEVENLLAISLDWRIRLNLANAYLDLDQPQKAIYHLEKIAPEPDSAAKIGERLQRAREKLANRSSA